MARISSIAIKQQPQHYTLTIRQTINFMEDYAQFFGQCLSEIGAYMEQAGIIPSEGPLACFHNTDLERLDLEVGWPIALPVEGTDQITCSTILPRKIVTAIDQGPYEEQDPTLMDLFAWIEANKAEPAGPICYIYLNDTERPPAQFLTQMIMPIR